MAGTAHSILDALAGLVDAPVAMAAAVVTDGVVDEAYDLSHEPSRFEFNSIGKTMTGQVLAALVLDGLVGLDDEIGKWLDAGANGDITFRQLATHASGLPRMPGNFEDAPSFDPENPYATYGAELAEAALRDATRGPSGYSNFGLQLLGLALERVGGVPFAELLRTRVFEPFGLVDATVGPGPNQVQGYCRAEPTPAWTDLLAGPGGVNGTLRDLMAWGRAVLDPTPALQFAIDNELGWQRAEGGLLWHNGGSAGGHACLVIDPAKGRVVGALVATSDLDHVDDATFLACVGRDPMDARPEPIGNAWNAPALAFVELLVAQDWEASRLRMSASCADALTVGLLSEAWADVMGPRGDVQSVAVTKAARTRGAITVQVELRFVNETGESHVAFDTDGKVVGLRIF